MKLLPKNPATATLFLALFLFLPPTAVARLALPDFTSLVEANSPAVVNISTTQVLTSGQMPPELQMEPGSPDSEMFREFLRKFFEQQGGELPQSDGDRFDASSSGSGFVISADGFIVTNNHVVKDADEVVVRLSDRRVFVATVVGNDSRSDIALLKIEASGLPVLKIGSSEKLKPGEWVLAIGSPFGFEHSVTAGIVSAKGRSLPSENYVPFIQTDVAINPGNSGGPLFNMDGEVVGINSQIYSRTGGFMGLSFSIPIEVAMNVVEQLKTTGKVSRGWLGVYIQEVTRELAESFSMDKPGGALVAQVIKNSPAEKAGIEVGDIILSFADEVIDDSAALPPKVGRLLPGKKASLVLLRNGEKKTFEVLIEELPDTEQVATAATPEALPGNSLGMAIAALTDEQKQAAGVKNGVMVNKVSPGAARKAGVIAGDIVVKLNNQAVESPAGFEQLVKALPQDRPVPLLVYRDGNPIFLALKYDAANAE